MSRRSNWMSIFREKKNLSIEEQAKINSLINKGLLFETMDYLNTMAWKKYEELEDENRHYRAVIRAVKNITRAEPHIKSYKSRMDFIKNIVEDELEDEQLLDQETKE